MGRFRQQWFTTELTQIFSIQNRIRCHPMSYSASATLSPVRVTNCCCELSVRLSSAIRLCVAKLLAMVPNVRGSPCWARSSDLHKRQVFSDARLGPRLLMPCAAAWYSHCPVIMKVWDVFTWKRCPREN